MANSTHIAVIAQLMACSIATARDTELKRRFISEYTDGFRRVEKFYRSINLVEETSGPGADKKWGGPMSFHWRANGDKFRDDLISQFGVIAQSRLSRGDVGCRIYSNAGNAKMAQLKTAASYSITEMHKGDSDSLIGISRLLSPRLAFAPYCVYESTLLELIKLDRVDVKSLEDIGSDNVKMTYTLRGDNGAVLESDIVFSKSNSWSILSHSNQRFKTAIEYGQTDKGVQVATRLTHYWNADFSKPALISILKEFKSGPVSDSVFTLAEFGLPELPGPARPKFPIYTTIGVGGVLLAIILGWILRRRTVSVVT